MDKRGILGVGLIALASLLGGCAESRLRANEADLDRIDRWLPGTYDNTDQAKADLRNGVQPPHDAVELAIVPLESVSIGRNSFYMQETAADDPRRVLSQKVVTFIATDKGIKESVATLVDPLRWRDGQRDADMFMGMTPKDLSPLSGCDLTWKRQEESGKEPKKLSRKEAKKAAEHVRLIGVNDSKHCRTTSHVVMGLVQVELRGELAASEFFTAELQYDSNGKLLAGNPTEPFYRFHKVGGQ